MKRFRVWRRKRARRRWSDYRFILLLIFGLIALYLGLIGFTKNSISTGANRTFLDNLYLMLGLLSVNSGSVSGLVSWELQVARFLVPFLTAYTALLALTVVFTQQLQHIRLWFIRDHIIICGLGKKGLRLSNQFLNQGEKVVVLESDDSNISVEAIRSSGCLVFIGDATNPEILQKVRLNKAKYLISVIGDEGQNAAVAVQAKKIAQDRDIGRLTCAIHITDPQLWHLLRQNELSNDLESHFRLELFNIFDRGANLLLKSNSPRGIMQGDCFHEPHFILIGLGNLGQSLVVQSALHWWEARTQQERCLRFTIIDLDADQKLEALCVRYPFLNEVCAFKSIQINVLSVDFLRADFLYKNNQLDYIERIFICIDNDSLSLKTGLVLHQKTKDHNIPLIIRMVNETGLTQLIQENENKSAGDAILQAFPLLDQTCTPDLILHGTHEILSRELYESYLQGLNSPSTSDVVYLKNNSWEDLDEYSKDLNRKQADRICAILEEQGYWLTPLTNWNSALHIFTEEQGETIEAMAHMEHELWCQEMLKTGWKYGPIKSKKRKTNPALVAWENLPKEEIDKNLKFIYDLPKILTKAGFQIDR